MKEILSPPSGSEVVIISLSEEDWRRIELLEMTLLKKIKEFLVRIFSGDGHKDLGNINSVEEILASDTANEVCSILNIIDKAEREILRHCAIELLDMEFRRAIEDFLIKNHPLIAFTP